MLIKDTSYLYSLTVRARFAYGIICIEKALKSRQISNRPLDLVIDTAWKYVEEEILTDWDDQIKEIMPWGVLDPYKHASEDCKFVSMEDFIELKQVYNSIPDFIPRMMDLVIFMGIDCLYTNPSREDIKDFWEELFSLMKKNKVDLPEVLFDATINNENKYGIIHSRLFYKNGNIG